MKTNTISSLAALSLLVGATLGGQANAHPRPTTLIITAAGLGVFVDGAPKAKLANLIGKSIGHSDPDELQNCDNLAVKSDSDLSLIVEKGIITSVIINTPRYATASGVRIGFPEATLKRIYGKRLVRSESVYDDAPAAIYTLKGPGRTKIVFDVNHHRKVSEIRTGRSASYIERCL